MLQQLCGRLQGRQIGKPRFAPEVQDWTPLQILHDELFVGIIPPFLYGPLSVYLHPTCMWGIHRQRAVQKRRNNSEKGSS